MTSYNGEARAWDGGPPGAEADYVPPPPSLPTTDPWTGASYNHYPSYDQYQGYSATYGYGYDSSSYYPRNEAGYYEGAAPAYPPPTPDLSYSRAHEPTRSPNATREYERRRSNRSKSRSVSSYDRRREYSKRDPSYEDTRWCRSRSASKNKYTKYSSSDRSSYKRSYSRSPKKIKKERRSSSDSSRSERSYKKAVPRNDHSLTPPLKQRPSQSHSRLKIEDRVQSPVKIKREKKSKSKEKSASYYEAKLRDRKEKDIVTPPGKRVDSPKNWKRSNKSVTPPIVDRRTDRTLQRKKTYKERKLDTPPRKLRDSSVTPPRCYARNRSSSRSQTRSRSLTPKTKHKRSRTPKRRKRSSSSRSTASSASSRSKRRMRRKSVSHHESRSKSRSRRRSVSRSRSRRRSGSRLKTRRSRSPEKSKPRSRSRSSGSRSGTPTDEECRGQFTVADRKRFWKMHKSRQEQAGKTKSPPKEVIPPPGAVETSYAAGIEYGDPPEVEGPNFAELLQKPDPALQGPSSSKSKPVQIPIKNDGSFLEMFKKMQEQSKTVGVEETKPVIKKPVLPFIGKRRGGRVLKTGLVKKAKAIDEQTVDNTPKDAWSLYMQEVKKYRETSCEEERKTRPLVK